MNPYLSQYARGGGGGGIGGVNNRGGVIGFGSDGGAAPPAARGAGSAASHSFASAPSKGVVFFTIRPGDHPATVNSPRGKVAVDFVEGALANDVLDQIAEMHGISRSKFAVTAVDAVKATEVIKPTDRLFNYQRITVIVVPKDISGGDDGGGLFKMGAGGPDNGIGYHSRGGGGIVVMDGDDVFSASSSGAGSSLTSPISSRAPTYGSRGMNSSLLQAVTSSSPNNDGPSEMSLERELVLTGLSLPLNLAVNFHQSATAVGSDEDTSSPACELCTFPVADMPPSLIVGAEYTYTSADTHRTFCCGRYACEQCCRYTVEALGFGADRCPICNSLTDEAIAKGQQKQATSRGADLLKVTKKEEVAGEITMSNAKVEIGVKRERPEEGGGELFTEPNASLSNASAAATGNPDISDSDSDDDLIGTGKEGTLQF